MSRQHQLSQWNERLASQLPRLSKPQIWGLACWSFAIVVCRYCGLSRVALLLATLLDENENSIRERLRDLYRPADKKRGDHRRELDVSQATADLLAWVAGDAKQLVLALDATNLGDRFHILVISVCCRGGAIPIAWRVLPGGEPDAWNPHWKELLNRVKRVLDEEVTVIALTDRGLESRSLFESIKQAGFHPLMRLKQASAKFRPAGWKRFYPLERFAELGRFAAEGELYQTQPLACHLLIRHEEQDYEEAWILATDLPAARPAWYAFRSWIEQGFKDFKRGGFHWQRTRMTDPARVERLWLALSLALLWTLEVGAELEVLEVHRDEPPTSRHHSLTVRGHILILAVLLSNAAPLWQQILIEEPPPLPDDS
jgi:hypothetical protein